MSLSILFSIVIYQVAYVEIETRLSRFETSLQTPNMFANHDIMTKVMREKELKQAQENLSIGLFYVNLFILVSGGFASYFLARWHLLPIEKAHEAQSRFTSDASHELRTPLAVMKTEIEVALRDNNASTTELKEILASNLEEVDKLTRLSEMLLNLSRIDSVKLKLGPVNLTRLVKKLVGDLKKTEDRLILKSKKQYTINGNEVAIADLIKILIDNALKYSPKDTKITITMSANETCAKFEVKNFGPGIKPEKLPHIFDRFYRADSSRTTGEQKGYGLGLALAKSIVDLHGGEIIASSIPNDETIFTAILPLYSKIQANPKN